MWQKSIYKNKKENLSDLAKYYYVKSKQGVRTGVQTIETVAWAWKDINNRMEAGNERAFGKYRKR